MEPFGNLNFM